MQTRVENMEGDDYLSEELHIQMSLTMRN